MGTQVVRLDRRRIDRVGWLAFGIIVGVLVWLTAVALEKSRLDARLLMAVQSSNVAQVSELARSRELSKAGLGRALVTCTFVSASAKAKHAIMRILLDRGADPNVDSYGQSALENAVQSGDEWAARAMIEHHANVNARTSAYGDILAFAIQRKRYSTARLLLKSGAKPNATDPQNQTALGMAVEAKQIALVSELLAKGADPNRVCNSLRDTPLSLAASVGSLASVQILLAHGATVDALNRMKMTSLLEAIQHGDTEMVKVLVSHGANVNNATGIQRPLAMAKQRRSAVLFKYLKEAGATE